MPSITVIVREIRKLWIFENTHGIQKRGRLLGYFSENHGDYEFRTSVRLYAIYQYPTALLGYNHTTQSYKINLYTIYIYAFLA